MGNEFTFKAACVVILFLMTAGGVSTAGGQSPEGENTEAVDSQSSKYSLGSNDVIRIVVEGHPEWSGEFIVKPDGTIQLRDVGEISVKGMTCEELHGELSRTLSKYINSPRVMVDMVQYKSQVIYVLGEVNRPGEYATEGKTITLRDAVILAGLPARFAATGRVYVITPVEKGRPQQRVINLDRVLYRGELQRNIEIRPGDIVYVPQTILGKLNDLFSAVLSPLSTVKVTAVQ